MYAFIPLSKVDKISQQLHRQPHPNHWSWHQNTRLPGPPGPPPPTRPILSSSSPSHGPQSLSQHVRKYGSSQTHTRSPTSSFVQNPGFPATQVSQCCTNELLVENHADLLTVLEHLFLKNLVYYSLSSLWKSSSILPPFLLNPCILILEQHKCHYNRLVRGNGLFLSFFLSNWIIYPCFVFHSGRPPYWGGVRAVGLSLPSPSLFPNQVTPQAQDRLLLTGSTWFRTKQVSITALVATHIQGLFLNQL